MKINPYKDIPDIDKIDESNLVPIPIDGSHPHPYAIVAKAYRNMTSVPFKSSNNNKLNQSLVVSGESGAGKTETCKSGHQRSKSSVASPRNATTLIEQKLLQSNPVLEAFGNAKTLR